VFVLNHNSIVFNQVRKFKVLTLLLIFFLIRIIVAYLFGSKEILSIGDTYVYNNYALTILNKSDWLVNPDFSGHYREPVYPIFLAIIYLIFGLENVYAVYFFQSILSTLTIYYIYKLSVYTVGRKYSILVLLWSGIYFFYIWYNTLLLKETLVFFLLIFSFYSLWIFLNNNKNNMLPWKFIIAFSILIHTDARYLFYIPFISILFIVYTSFYTGIKKYIITLILILISMTPWIIRNYIAYDRFILINIRTVERLTSDKLDYRLKKFGVINWVWKHHPVRLVYPDEKERKLIKQGYNPNNKSLEELNIIKNNIYPDSTYIARKIYWLKEMWRPARFKADYYPFPDARFQGRWSFRHNVLGILCYGILLPFMFFGVYYLIQQKNRVWIFLSFPIIIQTLLHILQFGRNRYRIPIDAFIIILSVYAMYYSYEIIKNKLFENRKTKKTYYQPQS